MNPKKIIFPKYSFSAPCGPLSTLLRKIGKTPFWGAV
jgi:hypothetical protein